MFNSGRPGRGSEEFGSLAPVHASTVGEAFAGAAMGVVEADDEEERCSIGIGRDFRCLLGDPADVAAFAGGADLLLIGVNLFREQMIFSYERGAETSGVEDFRERLDARQRVLVVRRMREAVLA